LQKFFAEILQRSEEDGCVFLSREITDDESRVHHNDPLTKRQSMELYHQSSPLNKKFKVPTSAGIK
jgi:hypothetical protein